MLPSAGITGDADQCRAEQAVADPIAAADLFEYLMIGQIVAFDHIDGLMHARIEGAPTASTGWTFSERSASSICLTISSTPVRSWSRRSGGFKRQLEVVQHREKLLDGIGDGKVAKFGAFVCLALAGVVEFSLEPCQAVEEEVALGLQAIVLLLGNVRGFDRHQRLFRFIIVGHAGGHSACRAAVSSIAPAPRPFGVRQHFCFQP